MVKAAARQRHATTAETLSTDVGKRIREARQARGMTLAAVGGEDFSRSFLSAVELGRTRPSLHALAIIADRLGLPMTHFLAGSEVASAAAAELALDRAEIAVREQDGARALRLVDSAAVPEEMAGRAKWLRGFALSHLGRGREAIPVLEEAVALVEGGPDTRLIIEVRYTLAMSLYRVAQHDEARIQLNAALDRATKLGDRALLGKLTVALGHLSYVSDQIDQAIAYYTRARELFEAVSDLANLGSIYSGLSAALERNGDLPGALRYSRLALGVYEARHLQRNVAHELNTIAAHYEKLNRFDEAESYAERAVERARQCQSPDVEAVAHGTLATIALRTGEFDRARDEADMAVALAPNDANLGRIEGWMVQARLAEQGGDYARADELTEAALRALESSGHRERYAKWAFAYSEALRARGDLERALEYALAAGHFLAGKTA